ncbi:cell filamentation protein Fic [Bradyrhizobium sp. WBOS7]|uniref:Cell filamentation protein Fic n=1 Tax=Bradyrhizobium betae TaxID=244734 RepID=A0AAE9NAC2_9BRAD|nr:MULTISPECIES: Fic family protein [Bradyrhizobium]MDD1570951.1 cell filamentation protein Fic [Bradyrhizobium sp. WBOS1]UUO35208.1 cell filamentation protein Fic [Bradyrhizobium sp. WBOS01]MDD1527837.1 cell filamentation protein Fic [Bradyrhizobium sp. WBOS2]MDD1577591.1 cell filamentation protein Fic [Bradyrhizobium sp. WBOS7]MDD1600536.1 cell filamentation protein Fic [Bradyrhizobium sp. WBOS16]
MTDDRHSVAETAAILNDPNEIALREAENGIRQFDLAVEMIRSFVKDKERPFRLRANLILQLHQAALDGIHPLAGTWRNTKVSIGKSKHVPPEAAFVSDEIQDMCEYVNSNWERNADHLGAYVLWKLNWIHPFADGNGRTARTVSYVVMSAKLDSLLPGAPTIPEQISANKAPYYAALEKADEHYKEGKIDVSELEDMLNAMLAKQLLSAAKQASGEVALPETRNYH